MNYGIQVVYYWFYVNARKFMRLFSIKKGIILSRKLTLKDVAVTYTYILKDRFIVTSVMAPNYKILTSNYSKNVKM